MTDLPTSQLRLLMPAQVLLFAVGSGWTTVKGSKHTAAILNHPTDGLTQIRLPQSQADPDYVHRMRDAVLKLAETEHRSPGELVYELSLNPAD